MQTLPEGAPATLFEAFSYIAQCDAPSIEHLKVMVMVEAAGKALYDDMAEGVDQPEVKLLLQRNGREELAHAHRVSRAIWELTGQPYPVPSDSENPYLASPLPRKAVTRETLTSLADGEDGGEQLYERWATNSANGEAAALFRLNGREELEHGSRLREAANLLAS